MTRQFINTIQPQTSIDEVFRVSDKQHRANRQGNMYLLLQLSDRTGTISGMRWNADSRIYESFQKGDFLRIQGAAQLHNGQLQLIVNQFQWVDPQALDPKDFDQLDRVHVDQLWAELAEIIETIKSEPLKVDRSSVLSRSGHRTTFQDRSGWRQSPSCSSRWFVGTCSRTDATGKLGCHSIPAYRPRFVAARYHAPRYR